MALSPEEKDRRRVDRKARDRAYRARRQELEKYHSAGIGELDDRFDPDINAAAWAEAAMIAESLAARENIDRQMEALGQQKILIDEQYRSKIEPLRMAWRAAADRKNQAADEFVAQARKQFPDIYGCWSAADWERRKKETTDV